jgi:hypothetical protein
MEKLCGLILFCSLSAAPLAMNGQMINDHPGPAENVGLRIDARVLTAVPTIGMPILVEMTISNKNEKPYEWWIDTPEAEYKNFDFVLVDDHSVEVKRTAFHRAIRGEWEPSDGPFGPILSNHVLADLAPGKQIVLQANLNRLFQIDHPGLYTLSISTKERVSKTTKVAFSVDVE